MSCWLTRQLHSAHRCLLLTSCLADKKWASVSNCRYNKTRYLVNFSLKICAVFVVGRWFTSTAMVNFKTRDPHRSFFISNFWVYKKIAFFSHQNWRKQYMYVKANFYLKISIIAIFLIFTFYWPSPPSHLTSLTHPISKLEIQSRGRASKFTNKSNFYGREESISGEGMIECRKHTTSSGVRDSSLSSPTNVYNKRYGNRENFCWCSSDLMSIIIIIIIIHTLWQLICCSGDGRRRFSHLLQHLFSSLKWYRRWHSEMSAALSIAHSFVQAPWRSCASPSVPSPSTWSN